MGSNGSVQRGISTQNHLQKNLDFGKNDKGILGLNGDLDNFVIVK